MLTSLGQSTKFKSPKRPRLTPAAAIRLRFWGLRLMVFLCFGALLAQLWRLQIVEGRAYQSRAEVNRIRLQPIPPIRGVIFDRNLRQLVRNVPSFVVTVTPFDLPVEQQARVAERLAKLLNLLPEEVERPIALRRLRGEVFQPVIIKSGVDQRTAFLIEENNDKLPGVQVRVESVRQYLGGPIYSHVLGYTGRITEDELQERPNQGYTINDRIGKTGVELTFEEWLRGQPGKEQIVVNAQGRQVGELDSIAPVPGANLVLTIDSDLQSVVAEAVRATMGNSTYAVGIVANVKTGEILAFVSLPGYDNNLFSGNVSEREWNELLTSPSRPLVNHGISDNFPPGSIFKLITGAAALQERIATPETKIFSKGYLEVRSEVDPRVIYIFRDWAAHGWLDFYQAMARSGDVYFYQLAGGYEDFPGLGVERLAAYARAFGLGQPTGIDLPSEVGGIVPTPEWKRRVIGEDWYKGDTYNMSIGQGFWAVTPLQMLMVITAFANGGEMLRPLIVKEIRDANNNVIKRFNKEVRWRVPVEVSNLNDVSRGMVLGVTWEQGTAREAGVPGMNIAAKTGTAEFGQRDPRTGAYEFQHGWCYAFGPTENPEIAVLVFHERGGGPQTAAPAVGRILRYYFSRGQQPR
ncbi:MAG: penicillin-binding protein 2 [Dehalococcoidia bacterium]|nr:MAG: penicillin-binding protein 2 [Dehalococcoidia bacterium]